MLKSTFALCASVQVRTLISLKEKVYINNVNLNTSAYCIQYLLQFVINSLKSHHIWFLNKMFHTLLLFFLVVTLWFRTCSSLLTYYYTVATPMLSANTTCFLVPTRRERCLASATVSSSPTA